MIYDAIFEANRMFESGFKPLYEKMITYDGELAPKFGWCVIYVGGPGSGKGSATKFKTRLQGRYYNVDDLKETERAWDIRETDPETGKYYTDQRTHRDHLKTPSEIVPKLDAEGNPVRSKRRVKWDNSIVPKLDDEGNPIYAEGDPIYYDKYRNMRNSEFVSELHDEMKGLGTKWKKQILNNPEDKGNKRANRLPNVIFDITGDQLSKLQEIIEPLKAKGYKIAIIWILSTIEQAKANNSNRPRAVLFDKVFLPKHRDVILAQEALFETGYIKQIDEFWVVDSASEINPFDDPVGYVKQDNVYNIPLNEKGLMKFDIVCSRIAANKKAIEREMANLKK